MKVTIYTSSVYKKKIVNKFLKETEGKVDVPYRQIREHFKNHKNTLFLSQCLTGGGASWNIYLAFIDSESVEKYAVVPTVMTTGYRFSYYDSDYKHAIQMASKIDRYCSFNSDDIVP